MWVGVVVWLVLVGGVIMLFFFFKVGIKKKKVISMGNVLK